MIRKIIHIDEDKCNGCGKCAAACHEGAIDMVNGKARLVREHYCDGLGDCLPACPTGAITFEEREAPAYDEAAVKASQAARNAARGGCPGSRIRDLSARTPAAPAGEETPGQLTNWPIQLKLAPLPHRILTAATCCWPLTVPRIPTARCTAAISEAAVCSSPAPSWMPWITPKSLPPF